jgi:hypothetical protein
MVVVFSHFNVLFSKTWETKLVTHTSIRLGEGSRYNESLETQTMNKIFMSVSLSRIRDALPAPFLKISTSLDPTFTLHA